MLLSELIFKLIIEKIEYSWHQKIINQKKKKKAYKNVQSLNC